MSPSALTAHVLVDELLRSGVREAVLAPGSRSAPLALALHDAEEQGRVRLHVRIDERSAGFLAVGLARTSGSPVVVLTTSGTAVANLHPAVLEASHAGVPLVLLTADRPARLRGTGANQTTDQVGIFGPALRFSADVPAATGPVHSATHAAGLRAMVARALAAATGIRSHEPGPAHVNVQLDEPLLPASGEDLSPATDGRPDGRPWSAVSPSSLDAPDATPLEAGVPTVVVAGDGAGPSARMLAVSAGWPLLAEPTSGARTGSHALRCYRLLLDSPLARQVERVVVLGHPTLSRPVMRLLARTDRDVVVVPPQGSAAWTDPGHAATRVLGAVRAEGEPDVAWLAAWTRADKAVAEAVDAEIDAWPVDGALVAHQVARAVAQALPPRGLLVAGSSSPVRDLDLMATPYPVGERRKVLGNRGLAGIDGVVSTAVGAALARRSSRALAYVGDLTFLHDANGLLIGPREPRPDLTVVVANDDGGSIFATLEQGGPEHAQAFERLFGTPHGTNIAALCRATGTPHQRCDGVEALTAALEWPAQGVEVVEVPVDRSARRALEQRLRAVAALTLSADG